MGNKPVSRKGVDGVLRDQDFFRGNRDYATLPLGLRGFQFDRMKAFFVGVFENLRFREFLHEVHEFIFGQLVVGLGFDLGFFFPIDLHKTVLRQQGVLEPRVKRQEAVILAPKEVIHVVCGLFRGLLVIRFLRLELHDVVRRGENLHQRRHDPLDGVRHVTGDVGRPTLYLVSERFAVVILKGLFPLIRKFSTMIAYGLADFVLQIGPDFVVSQSFRHFFAPIVL